MANDFMSGFTKRTKTGKAFSAAGEGIKGVSNFAKEALTDPDNAKAGSKIGEMVIKTLFESAVQSGAKWLESQSKTDNPIIDKAMGTFITKLTSQFSKAGAKYIAQGGAHVQSRLTPPPIYGPAYNRDEQLEYQFRNPAPKPAPGQNWYQRFMADPIMGMGLYHAATAGLSGVVSSVAPAQQSLITSSMLQNQLRTMSSTAGNYKGWNTNAVAAGHGRGYLDTDSLAAASGYMPFARRSSTNDLNAMAGFSSAYGQDYAAWGGSMGDAARLGLVGQRRGDVNAYQSVLAGSYGAISNPAAKMGDYTSGVQDLARIMASNTVSTPSMTGAGGKLSTWMSMYQGLNKMGPLTSGTAGAALLAQANQGIVNGGNGSASTQLAYYQALGGPGGISPSALQYIKEQGLTGNTFQKLTGWANKNYAGFSKSDRLMATSNLFGVNMHQMEALQKAAGQHGGMLSTKQINAILHPGQTPGDKTRGGAHAAEITSTDWTKTINDFITNVQHITSFLGPFKTGIQDLALLFAASKFKNLITKFLGGEGATAATDAAEAANVARTAARTGARAGRLARMAGRAGRVAGSVLDNPVTNAALDLWTISEVEQGVAGESKLEAIYKAQHPGLHEDRGFLGLGVTHFLKKGQSYGQGIDINRVDDLVRKQITDRNLHLTSKQVKQLEASGLFSKSDFKDIGAGTGIGGGIGPVKTIANQHLTTMGDTLTSHMKAANKDEQDLVTTILNTHAPLLPRTKQQLSDILKKFQSDFGTALAAWVAAALGGVGTPGDPSSGGSGGSSADYIYTAGGKGSASPVHGKFSMTQGYGVSGGLEPFGYKAADGSINYTGNGTRGRWHNGIDLGTPMDTPIYAGFSGKVKDNWDSSGFGQQLTLDNGKYTELFGHTDRNKIIVHNGQMVRQGDLIGYTGSSGNSTGPHLHFSVINDQSGNYIDPTGFLNGTSGTGVSASMAVGGGGSTTGRQMRGLPKGWEAQLLKKIGAPVTPGNVQFVDAWATREGGNAKFNPFNTTQFEQGASAYNTLQGGGHVYNYTGWGGSSGGMAATAATMQNGYYGDILRQMRSGNIKPGDVVSSSDFHTWSGPGGYGSIDTKLGVGGGVGPVARSGGGGGKQPVVHLTVEHLVVEVTMPDGTKMQATGKIKYNGVAGVHVQKNHGHLAHPNNKGHVRR